MNLSLRALCILIGIGVVTAGLLGYLVYTDYMQKLLAAHESERAAVEAVIQEYASAHNIAGEFAGTDPERHRVVFSSFFNAVQSADIFRVKVWNGNYTIIWSDLAELIGQSFPDNHDVKKVIESGSSLLEVGQEKIEHETERQVVRLLEVYVPIKNASGEVVGIFEVYKVATTIDPTLSKTLYTDVAYAVVALLIVLGILYFIVRRV
jgi:sensor histidine kinase regulating citrate/malate metabolism